MLSGQNLREPTDLTSINVDDVLHVQWWSAHFKVTPEALRAAVAEHGPSAEEIGKKLKHAAKTAFSKGGED